MRFALVALMSGLVLVSCRGAEETTTQGSTTCDPETFAFLVGQDKSALEGVIVPEVVRVLGETDPATMDYLENRLNVVHDADGTVVQVRCG